jgi:hypothetical protein
MSHACHEEHEPCLQSQIAKASQSKVQMYQKEKEQKLLEEETPIEEIFDHKKVFLMACSSAPKNADDDYSDNFEPMTSQHCQCQMLTP